MDINKEARETFESLLEDFAGYKANIEDDEKRESMEYDREEIDNSVYSERSLRMNYSSQVEDLHTGFCLM